MPTLPGPILVDSLLNTAEERRLNQFASAG